MSSVITYLCCNSVYFMKPDKSNPTFTFVKKSKSEKDISPFRQRSYYSKLGAVSWVKN